MKRQIQDDAMYDKEEKKTKRVWLKLAEMFIKYKTQKAKADDYEKKYNRLCKRYWQLHDEAEKYGIVKHENYYTVNPDED